MTDERLGKIAHHQARMCSGYGDKEGACHNKRGPRTQYNRVLCPDCHEQFEIDRREALEINLVRVNAQAAANRQAIEAKRDRGRS